MLTNSKVLVIDDMSSITHSIEAILEDDYKVIIVNSGPEALKYLENDSTIDLILLDIIMPNMSGYEVAQHIKSSEKLKDIPLIFLSSDNSEESEEQGFKLGAVDYITKPIRPAVLLMRVKTHITLKRTQEKLKEMALHDPLTSLYNRYYLNDMGLQSYAYAKRHHQSLCVVMLDIDHFKRVNDTHGHDIGDAVLKAVAQLLKKSIREDDILARFGGEEFVIIFKNSDRQDSYTKAEQMRQNIATLNPNTLHITASFGIAHLQETSDGFEALLKNADEALYEAKKLGRNRTVHYSGN